MARLLTPADYGLIGMLLIFIQIGEALASGGMTQALVARGIERSNDRKRASIFNFSAGALIYLVLWFAAPAVAYFYNEPRLIGLTRIVGITVPLQAGACLPEAILMSQLAYRRRAIASVLSLIISGSTGIVCSAIGLGVWSIAIYMVTQALSMLVLLYFAAKKAMPADKSDGSNASDIQRYRENGRNIQVLSDARPQKSLFKYGLNLIGARLADVAYINSYLIIIGRLMPVGDVGLFTRARQFASVPSISMSEVVRRVSYPILCKCGEDEGHRIEYFKRMTGMTMCVAFPIMLALAVMSGPIVAVVLGDKWLETGPLLAWLCLGMIWTPFDGLNLTLILASDNPSGLMKIEIVRKVIGLAVLLISFRFGLKGICIGFAISSFISMSVTAAYALKKVSNVWDILLKSVTLPLLAASLASIAGLGAAHYADTDILKLLVCIAAIIILYPLILRALGIRDLHLIITKIKEFTKRKPSPDNIRIQ